MPKDQIKRAQSAIKLSTKQKQDWLALAQQAFGAYEFLRLTYEPPQKTWEARFLREAKEPLSSTAVFELFRTAANLSTKIAATQGDESGRNLLEESVDWSEVEKLLNQLSGFFDKVAPVLTPDGQVDLVQTAIEQIKNDHKEIERLQKLGAI